MDTADKLFIAVLVLGGSLLALHLARRQYLLSKHKPSRACGTLQTYIRETQQRIDTSASYDEYSLRTAMLHLDDLADEHGYHSGFTAHETARLLALQERLRQGEVVQE